MHGHSTQWPGFIHCRIVPPHLGAVILTGLCLFSIYFPLSHIQFFRFTSIRWVSSLGSLADCAICQQGLVLSVQLLSRVRRFATPWTAAHQASLSITNSQSLLKLMSIESVMPSNHLIFCHPVLLLPSIFSKSFPINLFPGSFQWVSSSHQVAKVLEFQLQHQSFQCVFRTDFL